MPKDKKKVDATEWTEKHNVFLFEQLNVLSERKETMLSMGKLAIAAQIDKGITQLEAQLKLNRNPKGTKSNEVKRNYQL